MRKIREQGADPKMLLINRRRNLEAKPPSGGFASKNLVIDFITVGKKGEGAVKKLGKNIIASFLELTYLPAIESLRPLAKIAIDEYKKKNYDKVVVFYTDYISTIKQETKIRQILPISKIDIEKQIAEMDQASEKYGLEKPLAEYKIEPSPN